MTTAVVAHAHDDAAGSAVGPAILLPRGDHMVFVVRVRDDHGLYLRAGVVDPRLAGDLVRRDPGEWIRRRDEAVIHHFAALELHDRQCELPSHFNTPGGWWTQSGSAAELRLLRVACGAPPHTRNPNLQPIRDLRNQELGECNQIFLGGATS